MRRTYRRGNFLWIWLINMMLNLKWSIPAWLLLIAHYFLNVPIWCFWAALGLWALAGLLLTCLIRWANACGNEPDERRENKNPYSGRNKELFPTKR